MKSLYLSVGGANLGILFYTPHTIDRKITVNPYLTTALCAEHVVSLQSTQTDRDVREDHQARKGVVSVT